MTNNQMFIDGRSTGQKGTGMPYSNHKESTIHNTISRGRIEARTNLSKHNSSNQYRSLRNLPAISSKNTNSNSILNINLKNTNSQSKIGSSY